MKISASYWMFEGGLERTAHAMKKSSNKKDRFNNGRSTSG